LSPQQWRKKNELTLFDRSVQLTSTDGTAQALDESLFFQAIRGTARKVNRRNLIVTVLIAAASTATIRFNLLRSRRSRHIVSETVLETDLL
jgi:hypothetical protein